MNSSVEGRMIESKGRDGNAFESIISNREKGSKQIFMTEKQPEKLKCPNCVI
jgi:hypothetical protein